MGVFVLLGFCLCFVLLVFFFKEKSYNISVINIHNILCVAVCRCVCIINFNQKI